MRRWSAGTISGPCRRLLVRLLGASGLKPMVKRLLRTARNSGLTVSMPQVLRALRHDPAAFTQGLHIHDGVLYESTGIFGKSSLRVIDLQTGEIMRTVPVAEQFAEGVAILGDRLVQLIWRSQQALVYRLPELAPLEPYAFSGEGWGLTATAEHYLSSNGSDEIVYRDRRFKPVRSLKVRINGLPLRGINDLAWAQGRIYCNVLRDDSIYVVSERDGKVLSILDCSRLAQEAATPGPANVLNGIAYDPQTETFYLTGKRWRKLFQVRFAGGGAS
ncbi:MAG: glutaminyl-peptide cyclotransferase [Gammaproteobacteria bacterium]